MTPRSRAIDAQLERIERMLQRAGNRLNAAIRKEDAGDAIAASDVTSFHADMRKLVAEAAKLRPSSTTGLASKARIVGVHYELVTVGRAVLRSLIEDLHANGRDRHR